MKFAKTCGCKTPLEIEDDLCSLCGRWLRLPEELPPDPKGRPESLAISMYESGSTMGEIVAETGLGEWTILRVCDPEKWAEQRLQKRAAARARYTPDSRTCVICEDEIHLPSYRRKYCSDKCAAVGATPASRQERLTAKKTGASFTEYISAMDRYRHLREGRGSHGYALSSAAPEYREAVMTLRASTNEDGSPRWTWAAIGRIVGVAAKTAKNLASPAFEERAKRIANPSPDALRRRRYRMKVTTNA